MEFFNSGNGVTNSCTSYDITVSCGKPCMHNVTVEDTKELSLVPGCVREDCGFGCFYPATEIILPPCNQHVSKHISVPLEAHCQTICAAVMQDSQSIEYSNPSGCIWTTTSSQTSVCEAHAGDVVTYTITFTNHSAYTLECVRIFDEVPDGLTIVPDSVHPVPEPGETLRTGISMGNLASDHSVTLTYSAVVSAGTLHCVANRAHAQYYHQCCPSGIGSCKSSAVKIKAMPMYCIRRSRVQACFPICDFRCFRCCYVYRTDTTYENTPRGYTIRTRYCIAVRYVDCHGKRRGMTYEGSVAFHGLSGRIDPDDISVCFSNLIYHINCDGNVIARFRASLYCDKG